MACAGNPSTGCIINQSDASSTSQEQTLRLSFKPPFTICYAGLLQKPLITCRVFAGKSFKCRIVWLSGPLEMLIQSTITGDLLPSGVSCCTSSRWVWRDFEHPLSPICARQAFGVQSGPNLHMWSCLPAFCSTSSVSSTYETPQPTILWLILHSVRCWDLLLGRFQHPQPSLVILLVAEKSCWGVSETHLSE